MPEATTLYVMTSIVVAGLVVWVAVVLATVKTPWARGPLPAAGPVIHLVLGDVQPSADDAMTTGAHVTLGEVGAGVDADDTARATPVALSEGKARSAGRVDDNFPTATVGAESTLTVSSADGTKLALQDLHVAWLGAEGAIPQLVRRTKEEARVRAEEALEKIRAGADFSEIQRTYDDPRTTDASVRHRLVQEGVAAARALEIDQTSGILETSHGFVIVKRIAVPAENA